MSESTALVTLVGRMKVGDLAHIAGLGLEELVAALLSPLPEAKTPLRLPSAARARVSTSAPDAAPAPPRRSSLRGTLPPAGDPPELADMLDRATYRQIHNAVDRWFLGHVLDEVGGNVSKAARRLRVSRKRVRVLWARLRDGRMNPTPAEKSAARRPAPPNAPPPPVLDPLLPSGTYREVHDTVDRWLLGHTLGQVDGNVSQAARQLAVSRKHLRDHLARVGLSDMTRSRGG